MTILRSLVSGLLLALLVGGASASAQPVADLTVPTTGAADECSAASPPCGWINPLIALDFDDKPLCRTYPSDCLSPPGADLVMDGQFRWYWEVSEDGTYPDDPATDIVVSFSGTASNPGWLDFAVEPETITISSVDLMDPNRYITDSSDPANVAVWYSYEAPITVTFSRAGEPTGPEMDRIEERGGIQSVFMKAKSTASSDRFKEAFGVEEFRFDAFSGEAQLESTAGKDAPGLAPIAAVGILGVAAVALRRRF